MDMLIWCRIMLDALANPNKSIMDAMNNFSSIVRENVLEVFTKT